MDWLAALTPAKPMDVSIGARGRFLDQRIGRLPWGPNTGVGNMGLNKDQIEGRAKQLGGKLQEDLGKLTGNKNQQAKGLVTQGLGVGQTKAGDLAEKMKDEVEGP
jgi:uncharacterized protein YjbJ (UPF0337 family)